MKDRSTQSAEENTVTVSTARVSGHGHKIPRQISRFSLQTAEAASGFVASRTTAFVFGAIAHILIKCACSFIYLFFTFASDLLDR